MVYQLWAHQTETIEFMNRMENFPENPLIRGGIIALEMGMGKTLVALHHCLTDHVKPSLIVTKKIILDDWIKKGIQTFFDDIKILVVDSKSVNIDDISSYDLVITTYSYCQGSFNSTDNQIMTHEWRRVIFDESHLITKRTAIMYKFAKQVSTNSQFCWCMTGTPMCNKLTDLKVQLEICGYPANKKQRWTLTVDNLDEHILIKKNADRSFKCVTHCFPMTTIQRNLYRGVLNSQPEDTSKKGRLGHIGGSLVKLRQISNGSELVGVKDVENHKVNKLIEITKTLRDPLPSLQLLCRRTISPYIETCPDVKEYLQGLDLPIYIADEDDNHCKMIIFTSFQKTIDMIKRIFKKECPDITYRVLNGAVKDKLGMIKQFQEDPSQDCLIMNYRLGAEGLSITNASIVVLFEPWWNDSVHQQAISRVLREGQKKKVVVHRFITENSIETQMLKLCKNKTEQATNLDKVVKREKYLSLDVLRKM